MDKEALLNIILNDLKEVETLVISFQGENKISDPFISLAERKLTHISEELSLLKTISALNQKQSISTSTVSESVQPTKTEQTAKTSDSDHELRIEQVSKPENKPEITETVQVEILEPEANQIIHTEKEETNNILEEVEKETVQQNTPPIEKTIIPESRQIPPNPISTSVDHEKKTPTGEKRTESQKEEKAKTLGESFIGEKRSVNDMIISNKQDKNNGIIGKPIKDLTKGLAINDRFLFQRELFAGNGDLMKQTLLQLNELYDFNSAISFIASNFNWDLEAETTKAFMNYIKRKY